MLSTAMGAHMMFDIQIPTYNTHGIKYKQNVSFSCLQIYAVGSIHAAAAILD